MHGYAYICTHTHIMHTYAYIHIQSVQAQICIHNVLMWLPMYEREYISSHNMNATSCAYAYGYCLNNTCL